MAPPDLIPVPDGHIASVVTHLEMTERPPLRPMPDGSLRLKRWEKPGAEKYRLLFRRIGEPWLWFSRLLLDDHALLEIVHHPDVALYAVLDPRGIEVGMIELDFRVAGECEIGFFGLIPDLAGKGHGRWMMAQTLMLAWRKDVTRVWLHSCTLDAPSALRFYRRAGFRPYRREVELVADPRLAGLIPRDAAPHVPLID